MSNSLLWTGLSLGLITAVSPCPMATNMAATVWLSRHASTKLRALRGVLAYALGRIAAYSLVAGLLSVGLVGAPALSAALQRTMPPFIGPFLVLTAMVLLGLLSLPNFRGLTSDSSAKRLSRFGPLGEFALGILFGLTFCPISAALFFGSLLPPVLASPSPFPPILAYGIGTTLPVALFAIILVQSLAAAQKFSAFLQRIQPHLRTLTGSVLLALGLYLIARDTMGWPLP